MLCFALYLGSGPRPEPMYKISHVKISNSGLEPYDWLLNVFPTNQRAQTHRSFILGWKFCVQDQALDQVLFFE